VPELLRSVNKKADLDKIRAVCKLCRRYGLTIGAGFILGFPGETPAMTRQTIDYAKSLDIHYAQFNIFIPYPGTPLYDTLRARGELVISESDSDFISFNQNVGLTENELIYVPPGRTSGELKRWQRRAYREFYLRPKAVWLLLPTIRASNILRMLKSVLAVLKASFSRHGAK
jgi:magnesium-protoporphyrin IX monomethyl ester (oxidative) cyclase